MSTNDMTDGAALDAGPPDEERQPPTNSPRSDFSVRIAHFRQRGNRALEGKHPRRGPLRGLGWQLRGDIQCPLAKGF